MVVDLAVRGKRSYQAGIMPGVAEKRKRLVFHASDRTLTFIWLRYGNQETSEEGEHPFQTPKTRPIRRHQTSVNGTPPDFRLSHLSLQEP
jgi:hypothetical protein